MEECDDEISIDVIVNGNKGTVDTLIETDEFGLLHDNCEENLALKQSVSLFVPVDVQ